MRTMQSSQGQRRGCGPAGLGVVTCPGPADLASAAAAAEAAQIDHADSLAWSWLDGFIACARWATGERALPLLPGKIAP